MRLFILFSTLLLSPCVVGQALHLTGHHQGGGLGFGFMTSEDSYSYSFNVGMAFANEWDAGFMYGSSVREWRGTGFGGGTYQAEASTVGLYFGFVPTPAGRNDVRIRLGFSGQVASLKDRASSMTLVGLDFTAARPVGGAAYVLPSLGAGILFPVSHMQPTTVAAASFGLGVRGQGGGVLFEPMIAYVSAEQTLAKGAAFTIAVAFGAPGERKGATTVRQARTAAR